MTQVKRKYQREKNPTKGFIFACLIDGSARSLQTLKYAKDLAHSKFDKVYAVTVDEVGDFPIDREPVRLKVQTEAASLEVKLAEHVFLEQGEGPAPTLVDFINENEKVCIDFVIVASDSPARHQRHPRAGTGELLPGQNDDCDRQRRAG